MSRTHTASAAAAAATTAVAPMVPSNPGLVRRFAARFGVEPEKLLNTLRETAFRTGKNEPPVTNEQLVALMTVSEEYRLNPFLKEIYAFADQKGGIVPMIPVDGWVRIINSRPELQSITFDYPNEVNDKGHPEWIGCRIIRSDRSEPIYVREYMEECYRNTGPWNSHPRRMLRHKALIQCARVAFGFSGIYDPDEGERIRDAQAIDVTPTPVSMKPRTEAPRARQVEQQPAAAPAPTLADLQSLADKLGVPESSVLEKFEVSGVDLQDFPVARIPDALAWLNTLNAG